MFLWIGIISPFHVSERPSGDWGNRMSTADYLLQAYEARHETCAYSDEIRTYYCETHGGLLPSEQIQIYELTTH